jgi:hypothetical protein
MLEGLRLIAVFYDTEGRLVAARRLPTLPEEIRTSHNESPASAHFDHDELTTARPPVPEADTRVFLQVDSHWLEEPGGVTRVAFYVEGQKLWWNRDRFRGDLARALEVLDRTTSQ